MKSVFAFLTLAKFFLLFGCQLNLHEVRRNKLANEIEVNLNLLCGLDATFAVTLMDKDFVDKLIQHGNGQIIEVLVFLYQRNETLRRLLVLLMVCKEIFQSSNLGFQRILFLCILGIQSGISGIRQLAQDVVLIDFAE